MAHDRVEYRVAGAALRTARKRATRADLTVLEWRVLVAVMELTASWSKLEDSTSARQVAALVYDVAAEELDRGQRKRVGDALRRLDRLGVIRSRTSGRGRWAGVDVALMPHGSKDLSPGAIEDQGPPATTAMTLGGERNDPSPRGNTEKTENSPDACGSCGGIGWVPRSSERNAPEDRCPECNPEPTTSRRRRAS